MYFPRTVDEITAEWLTNALRESGAIQEARVVSFDIKALDGGFAGEVDRIVPVYDRNAPGFPDSFVIKLSHREADQRIMLDDRGLYRTEVGVYHALGSRDNIRLPRMYFADYDAGTGFCCLLLEDLSQFRPGHAFDSMTRPDADACMGYLARLHANWWNNAGLSEFEWLSDASDANLAGLSQVLFREILDPFLEKARPYLPECVEDVLHSYAPQVGELRLRLGSGVKVRIRNINPSGGAETGSGSGAIRLSQGIEQSKADRRDGLRDTLRYAPA